MPVGQFMDRGQAIGLQIGPIANENGWPNWKLDALVLLNKAGHFGKITFSPSESLPTNYSTQRESSGPCEISLDSTSQLLLVCDPLGRIQRKDHDGDGEVHRDSNRATLAIEHCYNLFMLGVWEPGTYEFKLTYVEAEEGLQSILRIEETGKEPKDLPLYFDGGHNCIHVDIDAMPGGQMIEEEGFAPQPMGRQPVALQLEQQPKSDDGRDLSHRGNLRSEPDPGSKSHCRKRNDGDAGYEPPKKKMKMKRGGKR